MGMVFTESEILDDENLSDRLILSYIEDSYDQNHWKPIFWNEKSRAFNEKLLLNV